MPEMPISLIKGDTVGIYTDYRDALSVNVAGVIRPILGAAGYMLQQPGLTQLGTGVGIDRGGVYNEQQGIHFRVSGNSLITVAPNGTVVNLGSVAGTNLATLPYSFNTQAVVCGLNYYLYDSVNGLRQVTDVNVGFPIDAVWVDGYYFFTDGEFLYHTDLDDEEVIDPLKFATSEFSPDPTIGLSLTADNKVIAWNRYTTEYFQNVANEFFAFTRISARTVKYGMVGTQCKAEIGGEFFFMGGPKEGNISVYQLGVGNATNIATREVDKRIAQYTEAQLSVCKLETRIFDNYPYLILHLPNETLMFNPKVAQAAGVDQAWTLLDSTSLGNSTYRAINGVYDPRIPAWVYGDTIDGRIGYLDETVATHYGNMVRCTMYTPFTYLQYQSIDQMEIFTIPGFTSTDDATVFVSLTYNGVTYGQEISLNYGAPSAYNQRFEAYRLGFVDNWVGFKFRWLSQSRMAFGLMRITHG